MNAAARAINQCTVFNGQLFDLRFSKKSGMVLVLLFAVLLSGLAVVYTTNAHRLSFGTLQQLEQRTHQLKLQWGQLLLEQASLAAPARVEELAIQKLQMHLPDDKQTFVLQSR